MSIANDKIDNTVDVEVDKPDEIKQKAAKTNAIQVDGSADTEQSKDADNKIETEAAETNGTKADGSADIEQSKDADNKIETEAAETNGTKADGSADIEQFKDADNKIETEAAETNGTKADGSADIEQSKDADNKIETEAAETNGTKADGSADIEQSKDAGNNKIETKAAETTDAKVDGSADKDPIAESLIPSSVINQVEFGLTSDIENLGHFDPFAEADETGPETAARKPIHIRIQQRNGRKTLTTVQGIDPKFSRQKILKVIKKKFACNGTTVFDRELGEVIQLQGDQRKLVRDFLIDKEDGLELDERDIKVHGF